MADWIHIVYVGIQKKTKNLKPAQRFKKQSQSSQSSLDEAVDSYSCEQTMPISLNFGVQAKRFSVVDDLISHRLILLFRNKIWSVKDRPMKIVLMRFLNHLNSTIKNGHFSIDYDHGSLVFCKYKQGRSSFESVKKKKQIIKIRRVISRIDLNFCSSQLRQYIPRILSHVNCDEIIDEELRPFKIKRVYKFQHKIRQFLDEAHTDLNKRLENLNNQKDSSIDFNTLQKIQNLVSNSGQEYPNKKWSASNFCDYFEIAQKQIPWNNLYQGQTYKVSKAFNVLAKSMINNQSQSFMLAETSKKGFVKKIEKEREGRSKNEIKILTHLTKFRANPNLSKSILCKDESQELIIEYCSETSLRCYIKMNQNVMSLSTKFNMLLQVAKGLRALFIRGVIHKNIKESNVLVEKNLNCLVNDMSWAQDVEQSEENAKIDHGMSRGCMLAPQYWQDYCCYKTDVFHFGRMMLSIILGASNYMLVIDRQLKSNSKLKCAINVIQRFEQCLPEQIAKQMAELCLRCLEWEPRNRIAIEWVITILHEVSTWLILNNF